MADRLADKVAIVIGGTSGIGRATVLQFAQEGAQVMIADRSLRGLEQTRNLASKISADLATVGVDVSNMVAQTVDCFGRVECLSERSWGVNPQSTPG